jgi:hypothetical protein
LKRIFTLRLRRLRRLRTCDRGEEDGVWGEPTREDLTPSCLKRVRGRGQPDMISVRHAANNAVPGRRRYGRSTKL